MLVTLSVTNLLRSRISSTNRNGICGSTMSRFMSMKAFMGVDIRIVTVRRMGSEASPNLKACFVDLNTLLNPEDFL